MSKDWQKKALELREEGYSNRAIGRKLGKDESVVRRYFKRFAETPKAGDMGTPVYWDTKLGDFTTDGMTKWNLNTAQQEMLNKEPEFKIYGYAAAGGTTQQAIHAAANLSYPFTGDGVLFKRVPEEKKKPLSIIVIADTQCKPGISLDYCKWIGQYIFDKKPDVVVHIGDHFDFPSLSSYDKGKKSFEGRRLKEDLDAGHLGMKHIVDGFKKDGYSPRMVFCTGNHCARIDRVAEENPEFSGFVGTQMLNLEQYGWEVYPFLKPAVIENIFFVHYLANPFTGKPYGGTAMSQLKTVGNSFVVGHKQILDVAIRPTLDGKHQLGVVNGACYLHEEDYKGFQGQNHFRGLTVLHEVEDGFALPSFVSLDYLKRKYS